MLGLVLEGGGARGAFQAGAIQALLDNGYEFDGVTGTSIGALNGAMIVQGEFEKSLELWHNIEFSKIFDFEEEYYRKIINREMNKETLKYLLSKLREAIGNRGLDTSKIREMVYSYVKEDVIRKSKMEFGIMTVNLSDLKATEMFKENIPEGKMPEYILASANFPGFKKLTIDNKSYIDGGLYDNLPYNMLAKKGFVDMIAITTRENGTRKVKDKNLNIQFINPSEKPGTLLNFSNESVLKSLKIGYLDGLKAIKNFKGKLVYVKDLEFASLELQLLALPEDFFTEMCGFFSLNCFESKMVNLIGISTKIAKLLKMKTYNSVGEVFLNMTESIALEYGYDRLNIVTFSELVKQAENSYFEQKDQVKQKHAELTDCFLIFCRYFNKENNIAITG